MHLKNLDLVDFVIRVETLQSLCCVRECIDPPFRDFLNEIFGSFVVLDKRELA